MNLAQLKTVTEQHQLSELFCQVYTMLLSAEKTPLQNLLCSDSPNKTQIGAIAVLFVFLSLASKPSSVQNIFAVLFYWPAGTCS